MNKFLTSLVVGALLIGNSISAKVSCNERMRHGPKGLAKGALAAVGAAVTLYTVAELKQLLQPLRIPDSHVHEDKKREALWNSLYTLCALASLAYVTWTLGASSYDSLKIYLDDDIEEINQEKLSMVVPHDRKDI